MVAQSSDINILTLSVPAVKAALRLSQLPDGRAYDIILIKRDKTHWELIIPQPAGYSVEICKDKE